MKQFLDEIVRRKVGRVAAVYMVLGWLVAQVAGLVLPTFGAPDWVLKTVLFLLALGFPIAVFLAWVYDLTPHGVRRTDSSGPQSRLYGGLAVFIALWMGFGGYLWLSDGADYNLLASGDPDGANEVITTGAVGDVDVLSPVPGFSGRAAVAVLPFVNMSDDREQQYFADGLTEDIITGLQIVQAIPVIARTSTFAYQGVNMDMRQIAAELGVGYLVEGSVRKSGDRVRITAQLIDADGRHLWAENFDRPLSSLMAIEDEITGRIVNTIVPEMIAVEAKLAQYVRTEDMEAWDYYLQALAETTLLFGYTDLHGRPVTIERNFKARELALKALELDPNFAKAYTLLTHIEAEFAHMFRADVSEEEAAAAISRGLEYGRMARRLSPFDSTACSCLSWLMVIAGDVDFAMEIQELAIAANPSSSNARLVYAWALLHKGELTRALEELELAKRLSPRDLAMTTYLSMEAAIHMARGDFDMAARRAQEATGLVDFNHDGQVIRILSLDALGRRAEAEAIWKQNLAGTHDFSVESLWTTPVPDALLAAHGLEVGDANRPAYHDFVRARLKALGFDIPA